MRYNDNGAVVTELTSQVGQLWGQFNKEKSIFIEALQELSSG